MLHYALVGALWRYTSCEVDFVRFESLQDDRQQGSWGAKEACKAKVDELKDAYRKRLEDLTKKAMAGVGRRWPGEGESTGYGRERSDDGRRREADSGGSIESRIS